MGGETDWRRVQRGLLEGDRLAVLELNRLVTQVLVRLRAYDFRDEWDDLRQEVLLSVLANARAGRLRDPDAFVAYVRAIARNKVVDRHKARIRWRAGETLPWDDEAERLLAAGRPEGPGDARAEVWAAVAELPEAQRLVIEAVYRDGKAYQEAAASAGLPLGTLKRRLSEGLRALRARLAGAPQPPAIRPARGGRLP
jgi:RNA polymerase sigma-70 factor (ECF subfamily)